jgi:cellobiose-specific phosphotransferase system component IIC
MGFVPAMWSVWGAFVLLFIVVKIFTGSLARDEDSQIFLGDSMQQEKSAQAAIVAKVNRIEPVRKATLALVGLATVFVIGYYLLDVYRQFRQ